MNCAEKAPAQEDMLKEERSDNVLWGDRTHLALATPSKSLVSCLNVEAHAYVTKSGQQNALDCFSDAIASN